MRQSHSFLDELKGRRSGHLPLPAWEIGGVGFVLVLLQFEQPQDQISQSGHGVGGVAARDLGSILAQADVPTVMRAVFTGSPMAANMMSQLLGAGLLIHQAGDIEVILLGLIEDLALAQLLAIAPHSDKLPAADQAGLFGIDGDPLEPPPFQTSMIFVPVRIVFRGKKNLEGV